MFQILKNEIYWDVLGRALLSLLPVVIGYLLTQNVIFWNVALITVSLGVGVERLKLGLTGISLHFLLIIICFSLLFFAFLIPFLFVIICALMAFCTIYFTRHGSKIRTLANYTFIPTVYLTCELHESMLRTHAPGIYREFMIFSPIAWAAVIAVYGLPYWVSGRKKIFTKLLHGVDLGEPEKFWLLPAIAIFVGVAIAASLVIFLHISRGEWVIWSVASVITLELSSSKKKFYDRVSGAVIGVPLGLLVAVFLPKQESLYIGAVIAIMLTLVAFKRYRLAFGCRCFFVAVAAFIASSTATIAVERIANVFLGGLIGISAVYIVGIIFKNLGRRPC